MKRPLLFMCLVLALQAPAQSLFRTAELERLATELEVDVQALPEGYSHPTAKGLTLTVHKTAGTVDHIGRQLFSDGVRSHGRMPVLNFLERYFLQLKYPPQVKTANMMARDDEFYFVKGSLSTVDKLLPTDNFSFSNDRHHYEVSWSRNGKTLLLVYFPVEYELISGENKIEAENNLMGDIQRTQVNGPLGQRPLATNGTQECSTFNVQSDATYLSEFFSNRIYTDEEERPIISSRSPFQSASNIMLSIDAADGIQLKITQVSYGFKKNVFTIPLQQWIAFCRSNGCELYFGVEDISDAGDVQAVVLAVNEQENYNHVLNVHVPAHVIAQRQGTVTGRLYPFIPTHNVMNMFTAYRKSNAKTIKRRK